MIYELDIDKKILIKKAAAKLADAILQSYVDVPGKFETKFKILDEGPVRKCIPILIDKAIVAEKYELAQKMQEHFNKAELTWNK